MESKIRFYRNTLLLFFFWLLLSGRYEPAYLILGLFSSVAVAWLHTKQSGPPNPTIPLFRFLIYLPWLLYRIALSNLHTVYLILHPKQPIAPRIIRYKTKLRNPAALALLANSITLTPGTVTAELFDEVVVVHALDEASAKDLCGGELEARIGWIFGKQGE